MDKNNSKKYVCALQMFTFGTRNQVYRTLNTITVSTIIYKQHAWQFYDHKVLLTICFNFLTEHAS